MADPIEVNGNERCTIYRLRYVGGPDDGSVVNSFRPYDKTTMHGHVYEAEHKGPACLVWIDDWTYDIHLNYVGKETTPGSKEAKGSSDE